MKLGRRYIWAFILCCYFAVVLALCLAKPGQIPALEKSIWGIPADKIAHFLMFLPYPYIAYTAFRPAEYARQRHLMVLIAVLAAGTGIAMGTERLQALSDYRSYEIGDFYADVIGMTVSSIIAAIYIILRKDKTDTDL